VNGSDPRLNFFRLLGDVDGDGVISDADRAAAPTVTAAVVDEGADPGSPVTSITIHFSGQVSLGDGAFELGQPGVGPVGLSVSTSVVGGATVAVLTFSGDGVTGGALADGSYALTVHGDRIHDGLGLALGHDFSGDRSADFDVAEGSDLGDLLGLF